MTAVNDDRGGKVWHEPIAKFHFEPPLIFWLVIVYRVRVIRKVDHHEQLSQLAGYQRTRPGPDRADASERSI
jgi:hypothetical protein